MLKDIAILTGSTLISDEVGYDLRTVDISMFGRCFSSYQSGGMGMM